MKLLITTRADNRIPDWVALTHPLLKEYAAKVGADFQVIDYVTDCDVGDGRWHYRIMKHYELHEEYDRILHIDTDTLIMPNCPNLFEVVDPDEIGTCCEDKGPRQHARLQSIYLAQQKFGAIGWNREYINTGVFVTSKEHREIYTKINGEYWTDWGSDDVHIGYLIKKNGFEINDLGYKFNHMTMFSQDWNGGPSRFDSHIIHYAGVGLFEDAKAQGIDNKLDQAKLDYQRVYG
jgi:lipopolysaccharide biosynthesis glycosyltransferase